MTIKEMESRFDSEWILVGEPETTVALEVVRGTVLHHSKDRDEVYRRAVALRPKRSAILYTGRMGNAADSGQLITAVLDHWERTHVWPHLVSTDDGYSSRCAREDLLQAGVAVVSISGAKGKKITPAADWQRPEYRAARADRSGVESLIFTLKDGYQFGQLLRRENVNVRAELTEKILAYNFDQIVRVRARRAREAQERTLTA